MIIRTTVFIINAVTNLYCLALGLRVALRWLTDKDDHPADPGYRYFIFQQFLTRPARES